MNRLFAKSVTSSATTWVMMVKGLLKILLLFLEIFCQPVDQLYGDMQFVESKRF